MKGFSDFLGALVSRIGQATLADQLKTDAATLSRFRSGQGNISLLMIDQLLDAGEAVIIPRRDLEKLEDTLETISDLWKEERRRKENGGRK